MKKLILGGLTCLAICLLSACSSTSAPEAAVLLDVTSLAGASPQAISEQWGEPLEREELSYDDGLKVLQETYYSLEFPYQGQLISAPVVTLTFDAQGEAAYALRAVSMDFAAAGIASTLAVPSEVAVQTMFGLSAAQAPDNQTDRFLSWYQPQPQLASLGIGFSEDGSLIEYLLVQY